MALVYPLTRPRVPSVCAAGNFLSRFTPHIVLAYGWELEFRVLDDGRLLGEAQCIQMRGNIVALKRLPASNSDSNDELDQICVAVRNNSTMYFIILRYERSEIIEKSVSSFRLLEGFSSAVSLTVDEESQQVAATCPGCDVVVLSYGHRGGISPQVLSDERVGTMESTVWLPHNRLGLLSTNVNFITALRVCQFPDRQRATRSGNVRKMWIIDSPPWVLNFSERDMMYPSCYLELVHPNALAFCEGRLGDLVVLRFDEDMRRVTSSTKPELVVESGAVAENALVWFLGGWSPDHHWFLVMEDENSYVADLVLDNLEKTQLRLHALPNALLMSLASSGRELTCSDVKVSGWISADEVVIMSGHSEPWLINVLSHRASRLMKRPTSGQNDHADPLVNSRLSAEILSLEAKVDSTGSTSFLASDRLSTEKISSAVSIVPWGGIPDIPVDNIWVDGTRLTVSTASSTLFFEMNTDDMTVTSCAAPHGWIESERTLSAYGEWQVTAREIRNSSIAFPILDGCARSAEIADDRVTIVREDGCTSLVDNYTLHPRPQRISSERYVEAVVTATADAVCTTQAVVINGKRTEFTAPASGMALLESLAVIGTSEGQVLVVGNTGDILLSARLGCTVVHVSSLTLGTQPAVLASCSERSSVVTLGAIPRIWDISGSSGDNHCFTSAASLGSDFILLASPSTNSVNIYTHFISLQRTFIEFATESTPSRVRYHDNASGMWYEAESTKEKITVKSLLPSGTQLQNIQTLEFQPGPLYEQLDTFIVGLALNPTQPGRSVSIDILVVFGPSRYEDGQIIRPLLVYPINRETRKLESPQSEEMHFPAKVLCVAPLECEQPGCGRVSVLLGTGGILNIMSIGKSGCLGFSRFGASLMRHEFCQSMCATTDAWVAVLFSQLVYLDIKGNRKLIYRFQGDDDRVNDAAPSLGGQVVALTDTAVRFYEATEEEALPDEDAPFEVDVDQSPELNYRLALVGSWEFPATLYKSVAPADPFQQNLLRHAAATPFAMELAPAAFLWSPTGSIAALALIRDPKLLSDMRAIEAAITVDASKNIGSVYNRDCDCDKRYIDGVLLKYVFSLTPHRRRELYDKAGISFERAESIRIALASVLL